ncbi:sodium-dependent dicarboxylate transporter SdcS [Mariprofundus micogutta]|uniref:Sodium-dependent dicarboxylate transporter SdcS n=1 Tax=Mariprofundus micogutta TaxID=1921010 RepID=A0A1L8CQX1_9PROT|nr:DASS family sodium-coupled anion symporter [Mariprofundus micogutta]GAV21284.1 sodium-dependent dicarboxylate transporter SdcS [Mariprofundus micogutta]
MEQLNPFANPGRTKLALVSQGVALPAGLQDASHWVAQANATESVIDIRLPSGHFATVPVAQPYSERSSIQLTQQDVSGSAELRWGDERLDIQVLPAPRFYRSKTRSGARMGSFSSLHENLLMLHPFMGCGFFARQGAACQYCQYDSMLNEDEPPMRDPLELVEVVRAALTEREIDTVYLYNGYSPGDDVGLSRLVPVIALLRRHLGHRQIALETVAPKDVAVIDALYAAGLDIFVCNLEVHDADRFAEVCPGKESAGGQAAIWKALDHARNVFRSGAVVSHLIVGLDDVESTKKGIDTLIAHGVVPLLQPFRPLPGTPLEHQAGPSLGHMEELFLHLYAAISEAGFPTHRLRHMGRVLTPMESRVLDGREAMLSERWVSSSLGRRMDGWLDGLRRHLRASNGGGDEILLDRRPMHVLLAGEALPFAALIVISLLAFAAGSMDVPQGLSQNGWSSLVVFALCLVLWVTQLLPLAVTSLLGLALLPLLDVLPASQVFSLFGNPAVFFILGAFMLAAGAMQSGLSERMALLTIDRFGTSPRRLLLTMLLLPAVMACFMPEHAVAALFLPIAWEIVRSLGLKAGNRYAQSIFFALAWGAIIGGVITLLGGARGPLALALTEELTGQTFSFADWTLAAAPIALSVLLVSAIILTRITPMTGIDVSSARERISLRRLEIGDFDLKSKAMGMLLVVTMLAWIFAGHSSSLAGIALISVVVMFALRLVNWRAVEQHVNWGVVLMYGGAIAIGKALTVTGAGVWLAHVIFPESIAGLAMLAVLALITLMFTEGVSNAAAVAIVLPVAIPVAAAAQIDPITVALAVGIISGFAFMLPMGTPPNAMIFGTGFVRASQMLRYGSLLSLAAFSLFIITVSLWWPLLARVGV